MTSLEEKLNITPEQLRAIFARPVAYHKLLAIAGGSVGAGVFLSQLIYWTDKTKDPDDWIYKTLDDWWRETALGRYELKTIRNALATRKLIEEKLCGVPAKLHYKIDWSALQMALAKAIITHRDGMSKRGAPTNKYVALPQTGDATDKNEAPPQATYRAESTTESTKTTKTAPPAPATNGHTPKIVAVSFAREEDSDLDIVDKLVEEFALSEEQGATIDRDIRASGSGRALQAAEVTREEPRENAGQFYMAAFNGRWKKRKTTVKEKSSTQDRRHESIRKPETVPTDEDWEMRAKKLAELRAALSTSSLPLSS